MAAAPYTAEELASMRSLAANLSCPNYDHPTLRMLATLDDHLASKVALAKEFVSATAAVEQERDELREAAGALLPSLVKFFPICHVGECLEVATVVGDYTAACDAHVADVEGDRRDFSHAPALRRLRALVEVKP